jgi:hypothetical protein
MTCEIETIQPGRSVKIEPCSNEATVQVFTRGWDGDPKVCAGCAKRYFSPKYRRRDFAEEARIDAELKRFGM